MTADSSHTAKAGRALRPLCGRCGSINVVRVRAGVLDKFIMLVARRRPLVCRRCGWRARRPWTDAGLDVFPQQSSDLGVDPEMSVLDELPGTKRRQAFSQAPNSTAMPKFSLPDAPAVEVIPPTSYQRPKRRTKIATARRSGIKAGSGSGREIMVTILLSFAALALASLLGLADGCGM